MRAFIALCLVASAVALAPLFDSGKDLVDGQYIVVYHENATSAIRDGDIRKFQIEAIHTYETSIIGYAAQLSEAQLARVRSSEFVDYVEQDQMMHAIQSCSGSQPLATWGITRVSEPALDLSQPFKYANTGEGTDAYIIDTGIYTDNVDFQGRAVFGFKASSTWSDTDANGHGTHVASTVGGATYGVAKKTTLIAVKVLGDNGSGTNSGVIAGVEYAVTQTMSSGKRSTGNMSLGGGYSSALNSACNSAMDYLTMVVAAGNDNRDASSYSPASAADVITVGATDTASSGGSNIDVRSYFSNYGAGVDIMAPGSLITAAWIGAPNAINTISGTSMASPHVAGLATAMLETDNLTPKAVKDALIDSSVAGVIDMSCSSSSCDQTPNRMAYNGC